jgi:hypothetical protein
MSSGILQSTDKKKFASQPTRFYKVFLKTLDSQNSSTTATFLLILFFHH